MAMYLGEDKVASLGSICNVSGSASKNLYDKSNVYIEGASNQNASNKIKIEPNTTYTFSIGEYTWGEIQEFNSFGTQTNHFGGSENDKIITFTTSSNAKYIRATFYTGVNNAVLGMIDFTQIQLERGSTVTSYEEYYEPKVFVKDGDGSFHEVPYVTGKVSKNLFNAYKYKNNTNQTGPTIYSINNTNELSVTYSSTWARLALILTELEPNTDYVISAYLDKSNYNTSVASGFYDGVYQDNGMTKGSGNVYFTFTTDATGSHEMQFYGNWSGTTYNGNIIYKNIQLEKGSVPTLYERHFEPTLSIKDSNGDYHEVPYVTGKVSKNLYPSGLTQVFSAPLIKLTKGTYTITEIDTTSGNWYFGAYKNGSVLSSGVSFSVAFNWSSTTEVWYRADETLKGFTFTLNQDCEVQIGRLNATGTQKVQLEKGSTATEYEEYYEPILSIKDSKGDYHSVPDINTPTTFTMTAGTNITIDAQYCYKIGKMVHINCSFTPTANIAMWAVILNGAPPTTYSVPVVASGWTDSVSPVCLYEYGGSMQNRQALTSGRQYRFSMTYIIP